MLKLLRRWLGWDADDSLDSGGMQARPRGASVTSDLLSGKVKPHPPSRRKGRPVSSSPASRAQGLGATPRTSQPRLSLEKAAEERFDPYNTGAFNRSASWERISRSGR
ncbi:MAG TPA: hypothetical protein VIN61_16585 [Gammaproteobacteria bacterium]